MLYDNNLFVNMVKTVERICSMYPKLISMGTLMSDKEKSLKLFASHIDEAHEASLKAINKFWSSSV